MTAFFAQSMHAPLLPVAFVMVLGVIFVNGWTDAPNAIATAVGSGAISIRRAISMAALCNLSGVLIITRLNAAVAMTMTEIVDMGNDKSATLIALTAALLSIILWSVAAWWFSIPTSESHALIAALTGAAVALHGNLSAVSGAAWQRIIWGLLLSVVLGGALGFFFSVLLRRLWGDGGRTLFRRAQFVGAAATAFMHGAQDGQKFLGVMLLVVSLGGGTAIDGSIPVWLMLVCAFAMALGTAVGGRRIIRAVGMDMVRLTYQRGFAADLGGAIALFLATWWGLPASTTHTKTTAVLGAGMAGGGVVDHRIARGILLVWIVTFPVCAFLGFLLTRLLLLLN